MAAVGSVAVGQSVEYFRAGQGEAYTSYYTGVQHSGEPVGQWSGEGAAELGLEGPVEPKAMADLYEKRKDPRDPSGEGTFGRALKRFKTTGDVEAELLAREPNATPERRRQIHREAISKTRHANAYIDFTVSLSKDLTVLHTAHWREERLAREEGRTDDAARHQYIRETIEDAAHRGNAAAVQYLTDNASFTRAGRGGTAGMRWVQAKKVVVATFFQHTSRANDPQLHFHNPILTAAIDDEGQVRSLDTTLIRDQHAAAAAEAARVTNEIITSKLGWTAALRKDGYGHEFTNVDDDVKKVFSERKEQIDRALRPVIDEFVEREGREPSRIEIARMKLAKSIELRPTKDKSGETREQMDARWDEKLRNEIGVGLSRVAAETRDVQAGAVAPGVDSMRAVKARAVARCQEVQSTWTRSDLIRAVEAELPSYLGIEPEQVGPFLEGVADEILADRSMTVQTTQLPVTRTTPHTRRLPNGQPSDIKPYGAKYASVEHVAAEYALQKAAVLRGRQATTRQQAAEQLAQIEAMGLSVSQRAAAEGIMTSGAALSVLIGPAGTGKTYVLGALSKTWGSSAEGRRVLGLATSEQATDVLRGEGVQAKNVAQWLGAQRRIKEGRASADDLVWAVRAGDIIVPDEASMADTDKLNEIRQYVDEAGARMLLTGDPHQLAAVGAGGAMRLVADTDQADVYTLAEPRRFKNQWENQASLDMREGRTAVVEEYEKHDRIKDGGTREAAMAMAARMYVANRVAGKSAVVVTPTNEMAAHTNSIIRDELIALGRVNSAGVLLERDGNFAGVGDIVKCRQNVWTPGSQVRNQGRYIVTGIGEDGSLDLREEGTGREVTVGAEYRSAWVELGYAGTVHSVQGSTVDVGIPVVEEGMVREAMYPAATRGREDNVIIAITEKTVPDARDEHEVAKAKLDASDVLTNIIKNQDEVGKAALTHLAETLEHNRSSKTVAELREEAVRDLCRDRTSMWLDELTADGSLTEEQREMFAADRGTEQLGRLLRVIEQAGKDPRQVLVDAVTSRSLEGGTDLGKLTYHRVREAHKSDLAPVAGAADEVPAGAPPEYVAHFEELADLTRARQAELGAEQVEEPSAWAVETLGPVPEDAFERIDWADRAGKIAAQREADGWTDEKRPLAPAPGASQSEARASWFAAWDAAGHPDTRSAEHEMSEGALRIRVRAMQRENERLPPSVFDEMQSVERELRDHVNEASLLYAQADDLDDDVQAAALREKAAEMEALAEVLTAKREALQVVDDERRAQYEAAEMTRQLGDRAHDELETRGIDVDNEPDRVTAEEWMELWEQAKVEDDQHRPVTEVDAPAEVWDEQLGDLVQLPDAVLEAELVDEQPAAIEDDIVRRPDDVVEAELVPDADEVTEEEPATVVEEEVLPAGVPQASEIDIMTLATRAAVAEADDRVSVDEAEDEYDGYVAEDEVQEVDDVAADDYDYVDL